MWSRRHTPLSPTPDSRTACGSLRRLSRQHSAEGTGQGIAAVRRAAKGRSAEGRLYALATHVHAPLSSSPSPSSGQVISMLALNAKGPEFESYCLQYFSTPSAKELSKPWRLLRRYKSTVCEIKLKFHIFFKSHSIPATSYCNIAS